MPVVQNWHQSPSLTAAKVMNMPMRLLLGCAGDQLLLFSAKNIHIILFAVGLVTGWIMASQSSTQTHIQNLTQSYLYLWICQALSCFRRYGPIAYRAVVAVAGCAPDPDLKAQVSSFFVLEFRGHRNREKGIKKVAKFRRFVIWTDN